MIITLEKSELQSALAALARIAEKKNTIAILTHVRIIAGAEAITLTATDLDISLDITLKCEAAFAKGELAGEGITVPANLLSDITRKLPEGSQLELSWEGHGGKVKIKSGKSRFVLQSLPIVDFPDITAGEMTHEFEIQAQTLANLINATSFAISTEETRYYLNGIHIHAITGGESDTLRAVATDGHRMAVAGTPIPKFTQGEAAAMPSVIIPRKMVAEIARMARERCGRAGETTFCIRLSPSKMIASSGAATLSSRLIDGTYPDYQRVIPSGNDKRAIIGTASIIAAVDRVATICAEKTRRVALDFNQDGLTLSANGAEGGGATESIEMYYDSEEVKTGVNSRYLLDILTSMKTENVLIDLADSGSPIILKPHEGGDILCVLMPLRV